ncbi:peptide chain release factor N(5)-glutamine methyltransferase [Luteibaculum oceani]|uniref:peptide chain release factor N(5)-glutamine methyltransferase n=2 Tax=Luteibaculum oceani TaxID=1294296 RepID=A0A5C6UYW3_9FLAO|nr:peptide chain release factor N(5)-glutamine methyltransferase [Luteibaculum oceani]
MDIPFNRVAIEQHREPNSYQHKKIEGVLLQLKQQKPIQYILDKAYFLDLPLLLNEKVLIPRPETEELVLKVIESLGYDFSGSIIDVGTGSGCIALALKKFMPGAKITGVDKSAEAIEVAKKNGIENNIDVQFLSLPVEEVDLNAFDIIVSNPPYIGWDEQNEMGDNVLKYEPGMALFSDDPNYFYKYIAKQINPLKKGKCLFYELNPKYAEEVKEFVSTCGFKDVEIELDLSGKKRMLIAGN